MTLQEIKQQLRDGPYAWPGGYPKFFLAADGEALSFKAVRENWRDVVFAHLHNDRHYPWYIDAVDINWEDGDLICGHTGERIESAYVD